MSGRLRRSASSWTWVTRTCSYSHYYGTNVILKLGKANGTSGKSSAICRTFSTTNNDNNSNNPNGNINKQQSATKDEHIITANTTTSSSSSAAAAAAANTTNNNSSKFQMLQHPKSNNQKQRFYLLDVSPYLDPATFCKNSASYECPTRKHSIDGTLAAKRLNRGKQMVRDLIKYQLCSYYHVPEKKKVMDQKHRQQAVSNEEYILANLRAQQSSSSKRRRLRHPSTTTKNRNTHPQPFILSGHGIPKQLLQDHLQLCQQVISHLQGEQIMTGGECFFHHSNNRNSISSSAAEETNNVILHVRNKGFKNKVIPWPLPPSSNKDDSVVQFFHDRFVLYVTVMNRLSSNLVQMLSLPNNNNNNNSTSNNTHEYWQQQQKNEPSYWNVHFCIRDDNSTEPYDYHHYINDHNNLKSSMLSQQQPLTVMLNDQQPIIIAQLSERSASSSHKASATSKFWKTDNDESNHSTSTSTVTNVRIQMHGMIPKEGVVSSNSILAAVNDEYGINGTALSDRVSMFYEACFYIKNK